MYYSSLLNLNRRQSIEPHQEHDGFDYKQDHGICEHGDNLYDEDKSKERHLKSFQLIFKDSTLEDVKISIVDFSRIVREADNCERRRSSFRS